MNRMQRIERIEPLERVAYAVGAALLLSGLVHLAILIATGASWEGPLSLRKPMTFGLSFGLTLITIVWVSSFVKLGRRLRTALIAAFTLACAWETALVTLQAWRGVPSHFNVSTPFDARIAGGLAFGGAVLVIVIIALTLASFRKKPDVPVSMRVAVRTGFVALLTAQIVGALMIAKGMTLVFAGHPQTAYLTAGTLKPVHAAAMHGIQFLPVLAWLLSYLDWTERQRLTAVLIAATTYLALAAAIAIRASLA
jgi:hypothetical protein